MEPIRLLLIEDDAIDQMAFKRYVAAEKLPFQFEMVKSLADAKVKLATSSFDIIVSDFNLGDGTALDVCNAANGTPLIIITGQGNEEIAVKAMKSGAYDYLIKDPERKYLKVLPLTVEKAANGHRAIVEKKKAVAALRASEEKLREFFDDDLAGAFICQPNGKLLQCNRSFARIFGFNSVEEALQYNLIALYPKSRAFAEVRDLVRLNKKLEYHEVELRRHDGNRLHVIQNVIGKFDAAGELVEIKGYIFDNTRHKTLEEQLRQAQKMEGIGTLAGGIAHDFNNILAIIMGHTHLLMNKNPELAKKANSVETIDRAVRRGSKLVKQILTFARRDEIVFESVNLNVVIEELQKMLLETFSKMIVFDLRLDASMPKTVADANQVHQALLNLCVNARDAMPNGGTIKIESNVVQGSTLRARYSDAHEQAYMRIRVSDSGTGMPPDVLSRMFEPFFTTKEIGKGTGLGLAVVYGVTKSHKGYVDVESTVGNGTTFTLYFPIRDEEADTEIFGVRNSDNAATHGSDTILVVEDEAMLLELVTGLLESKGYNVLTAMDGAEAIDLYAKHKDDIGLVLTDLGLPKVDGWDAFQRMKEINPDVKVIFASGYIDNTLRTNLLNAGAKDLVGKPYMADEILNRVASTLSEVKGMAAV
jgi:PAS domain S-box-containing protein